MWLDYIPKIWHSVHIFQRIKIFHDGVGLLGLKYYLFRNVRLFQIKSAREQGGIVLLLQGVWHIHCHSEAFRFYDSKLKVSEEFLIPLSMSPFMAIVTSSRVKTSTHLKNHMTVGHMRE